jgi:hypothetical protein
LKRKEINLKEKKDTIVIKKGRRFKVSYVTIEKKNYLISGKFLKIVNIEKEWINDVCNPEKVISELNRMKPKPDIFTFWQRYPDTEPHYNYYMELERHAAIPIKSFDYWWKNQINTKTRNMARKSTKKGVQISEVDFNDNLIYGIMDVFNEKKTRRGKRFWHYGKDFETVKREMSDEIERSVFIGAYYEDCLIGFIKLIITENYAITTLILDMFKHRDKSPMNALIAKAVEVCANRGIPYLTYTKWRRGSHGDFQKRNGFEPIIIPRYYIPITFKGKIILNLGLHRGVYESLPDFYKEKFLSVREWWYNKKGISLAL